VEKWHEPIAELIGRTNDDDLESRDLHDRLPPSRVLDGSVVLLGDAAHPMSPFRGQGGNSAMVDGIKLATALAGTEHVATALKSYAHEMIARVRPLVRNSFRAAGSLHTTSSFAAWRRDRGFRVLDWLINRKKKT
jgi:2-polyprenyl-6-methoxyphenol hydroxylase-like FAD-dependent oxidoreductase